MDEKKLIVFYNNKTYDITNFIKSHPGGNIIKNANNQNLIDIWKKFGVEFHIQNSTVMSILDKYVISDTTMHEPFSNYNYINLSFK
jgi:cytochrome b involved in lipid metabolism